MGYIREFRKQDLRQVAEIAKISLQEIYTEELYIKIHSLWPDGFLVAEEGRCILGFISGVLPDESSSRILMLAVRPDQRRRGIGSSLLQAFINRSAGRGVSKVTLEVRLSNQESIEFYQKRGFQITGRIQNFYTNGDDAFKMVKYI